MIKLNICGFEREYDSSCHAWIREQYDKRLCDGIEFWFRVHINTDKIGIMFSSPNCRLPRGGQCQANQYEKHIIDLWNDLGLREDCSLENLLVFLYRLEKHLN